MKKLLALLLALLMAFPLLAFADDASTEAQVITFQGIPWGSSVEDVRAWLVSNQACSTGVHEWLSRHEILAPDAVITSGDAVHLWNMGSVLLENGGLTGNLEGTEQFLQSIQFNSSELHPDYSILGVSPDSLTFSFLCDGENTALISVVVSVDRNWSLFETTYHELTRIYGEDESGVSLDFANVSGDWRYRKAGADATMVSFKGTSLTYGKINPTKTLSAQNAETAPAEAQVITFQGIPWGLSVAETKDLLIQEKGMVQGASGGEDYSLTYIDDHFESGVLDDDPDNVLNWTDRLNEGTMLFGWAYPTLIGGYRVQGICFDFHLEVENYAWNREATHLRQVSISLENPDVEDLKQKLTGLYGEPMDVRGGYLWLGAEDTAICLQGGSGKNLYYGKTNAMETIAAQNAEIASKPAVTADPADVGGL